MRVLVVEDEFLIRADVIEGLLAAGFHVDEAASGDEAADLIDKDGYSLVLTDLNMPGELDGMDVAHRARGKHPGIPILFITARPLGVSKFGESGELNSVIPKPYQLSDLIEKVRELLSCGNEARCSHG